MIRCLLLLFLGFVAFSNVNAQFQDDFSDGNLDENPAWEGDLDRFTVNDDLRMQLNAPDAGVSTIYKTYEIEEKFTWKFDFEMDFSPSKSNRLVVFLQIDNTDLSKANGYIIEVGENGGNDALVFVRLDNGVRTEIGRTSDGSMATNPAKVQLRIDKLGGLWSVKTDYNVSGVLLEEIMFNDATYDQMQSCIFGFQCVYTKSRIQSYSFDNIDVNEFVPDKIGPKVQSVKVLDPTSIVVQFDEIIEASNIAISNLQLQPAIEIIEIKATNDPVTKVVAFLGTPLQSGPTYSLEVKGFVDLAGNKMDKDTFAIQMAVDAALGDVIVNEVLFDPYSGQHDFIELYNVTEKIINLKYHQIANIEREVVRTIESDLYIQPNSYLALTKDPKALRAVYNVPDSANIEELSIPSLNIASGNVTLFNPDKVVIDSFSYEESWHYPLLKNTKGISLERIDATQPTNKRNNWFSASSATNYATPGYRNGNSSFGSPVQTEDILLFKQKSFSPNGDSDKDFLTIEVSPKTPGLIGTIYIYNTEGNIEKTLINNSLLGPSDIIRWNGLNELEQRSKIGHYILVLKGFDNNGNTFEEKHAIKLLDFIN